MTLDENLDKIKEELEHQQNLNKCEQTGCYVGIYEMDPLSNYGTCTYFETPKCQYKIVTDDECGEVHLCQRWKSPGKRK